MDRQKIFNKIAKHLLKQNKRSLNADGRCVYRGPNGLKCAIGCLIPDKIYNKKMDNLGEWYSSVPIYDLAMIYPNVRKYLEIDLGSRLMTRMEGVPEDIVFLQSLQDIHDDDAYAPYEWKALLKEFAVDNKLNYDVLK